MSLKGLINILNLSNIPSLLGQTHLKLVYSIIWNIECYYVDASVKSS